jgi:O-methyltransferase
MLNGWYDMNMFKWWLIKFKCRQLYKTFADYTMINCQRYIRNLLLIRQYSAIPGSVVECGTWRGGMIAGMASMLGDNRSYYLYDSFEGLPDAKPIDGKKALNWQKDKTSNNYHDNCTADEAEAIKAMALSGVTDVTVSKGWFSKTLPKYKGSDIAILRLDGDWYESTMDCLVNMFSKVAVGGVIIIDDYYTYAGCARAVHDYLSRNNREERIRQYADEIAYIKKLPDTKE